MTTDMRFQHHKFDPVKEGIICKYCTFVKDHPIHEDHRSQDKNTLPIDLITPPIDLITTIPTRTTQPSSSRGKFYRHKLTPSECALIKKLIDYLHEQSEPNWTFDIFEKEVATLHHYFEDTDYFLVIYRTGRKSKKKDRRKK